MCLIEEHDEDRFDVAAVRWTGGLALEARGLTLAQLASALQALDALPDPDARRTLLELIGEQQRGPGGVARDLAPATLLVHVVARCPLALP